MKPGKLLSAPVLLLVSCISYNYSGITQAEKLPDQGIIGMSREAVINAYGMPQRVVSLEPGSESVPEKREPALNDDSVIFIYRRMAQHRVIVYERTRESTYAVYFQDGVVSQVKTTLTTVGDGISFSPVVPGQPGKPE